MCSVYEGAAIVTLGSGIKTSYCLISNYFSYFDLTILQT